MVVGVFPVYHNSLQRCHIPYHMVQENDAIFHTTCGSRTILRLPIYAPHADLHEKANSNSLPPLEKHFLEPRFKQ